MSDEEKLVSHYRLKTLLRRDGFGAVYFAEDTRDQKECVLRVIELDQATLTRITGRVRARSQRDHPLIEQIRQRMKRIAELKNSHVLPVIEFGEEHIQGNNDIIFYMVSPYEKESLLSYWSAHTSSAELISLEIVIELISQAAEALHYVHRRGLIHQYVRLSSFMLRSTARSRKLHLYLTDFWFADISVALLEEGQISQDLSVYLASEQLASGAVFASDQYALAILAYELLLGYRLAQVDLSLGLYERFVRQRGAASEAELELARRLDLVLARALAEDASARYQNIEEFASIFRAVASGETILLEEDTTKLPAIGRRSNRRTEEIALAAGGTLAAGEIVEEITETQVEEITETQIEGDETTRARHPSLHKTTLTSEGMEITGVVAGGEVVEGALVSETAQGEAVVMEEETLTVTEEERTRSSAGTADAAGFVAGLAAGELLERESDLSAEQTLLAESSAAAFAAGEARQRETDLSAERTEVRESSAAAFAAGTVAGEVHQREIDLEQERTEVRESSAAAFAAGAIVGETSAFEQETDIAEERTQIISASGGTGGTEIYEQETDIAEERTQIIPAAGGALLAGMAHQVVGEMLAGEFEATEVASGGALAGSSEETQEGETGAAGGNTGGAGGISAIGEIGIIGGAAAAGLAAGLAAEGFAAGGATQTAGGAGLTAGGSTSGGTMTGGVAGSGVGTAGLASEGFTGGTAQTASSGAAGGTMAGGSGAGETGGMGAIGEIGIIGGLAAAGLAAEGFAGGEEGVAGGASQASGGGAAGGTIAGGTVGLAAEGAAGGTAGGGMVGGTIAGGAVGGAAGLAAAGLASEGFAGSAGSGSGAASGGAMAGGSSAGGAVGDTMAEGSGAAGYAGEKTQTAGGAVGGFAAGAAAGGFAAEGSSATGYAGEKTQAGGAAGGVAAGAAGGYAGGATGGGVTGGSIAGGGAAGYTGERTQVAGAAAGGAVGGYAGGVAAGGYAGGATAAGGGVAGGGALPPYGRRRRRRGRTLLAAIIIALLLLVIFGGVFVAFALNQSSATVTLTLESHTIQNTYLVTATTTTTTTSGQVQASFLTQSSTLSKSGQASGYYSGSHSTGFIKFYNSSTGCGCPIIIPAGTAFTGASGVTVVTDETVGVASLCYVTVHAHAVIYGPGGNIPAGDIQASYNSKITARSPYAFSGGQSAQSNVLVQQSDIDHLAKGLQTQVVQSAQASLQAQVKSDQHLLAQPVCPTKVKSDHAAGDFASSVTVTVTATCTAEVYDYSAAIQIVQQQVQTEASSYSSDQYVLVNGLQTTVTSATVTDAKAGTVLLAIKAVGKWIRKLDKNLQQSLPQFIAGKSISTARSLLSQIGVAHVAISVSGRDPNTLPADSSKITIVLKS